MRLRDALVAMIDGAKVRRTNWMKDDYAYYDDPSFIFCRADGSKQLANFKQYAPEENVWEVYHEGVPFSVALSAMRSDYVVESLRSKKKYYGADNERISIREMKGDWLIWERQNKQQSKKSQTTT